MLDINNTNYLTNELITNENYLTIHRTLGILPNLNKLATTKVEFRKNMDEVRNDPHVHSCIQSRKTGILAMSWKIISEKQSTIVDLINQNFRRLDILSIISNILDAIFYGFQIMEIIWEQNKDGFFEIQKVEPKPIEWFYFDANNQLRFRSRNSPNGTELPKFKFLVPRHNPKYENPTGDALLSKCFWPVTIKNMALRFWINFLEKYGMPLIIGQYTYPPSPEELGNLSQRLNDLVNSQTIATPSDVNIEIKDIGQSKSVELYLQLIKLMNAEISKALLSETLTTEMDSGSYAASLTHFKVRREIILGDKSLVERTFNNLIYFIAKVNNFELSNLPEFVLNEN